GNDTPSPALPSRNQAPPPPHAIDEALSEVWELEHTAGDDAWTQVSDVDVDNDGRPSPRFGISGAGLPEGGVVVFGGTPSPTQLLSDLPDALAPTPRSDETWQWSGGNGERPAMRVRAQMSVARLDPGDALLGLDVTMHASVASAGGDDEVDLFVWDGAGWHAGVPVSCGAGCASASFDADTLGRALASPRRELIVAAAPHATTGIAPDRVALDTDFVELKVRWRRP
ncbi:MAG TPA: hypothetical protein VGO62_21620, partial [Myxococcota bacterium]